MKKTNKRQMAALLKIAAPAFPTPIVGQLPTTVEALVQCLTNVAVNRKEDVRRLELNIHRLCELEKRI